MINGNLYSVFLDGDFVGIAEDEYECTDIVENYNNGYGKPLYDDDWGDRVWYHEINVNRWQQCEKAPKCVEDKYTGKSILCYSTTEVPKALKNLNMIELEREKAEAKLRALTL